MAELVNGSAASVAAAAQALNRSDVAVIQHEYGIYGGPDGDEIVEVMKRLTVPSIVIAHTVLKDPTPHQLSVLNEVLALADQVVVMSEAARARLRAGFTVDRRKVTIIPHGAALPTAVAAKRGGRPVILTWGLLGPGKGIERVIDAMPLLKDLPQRPRYLVAGRTHPKVLAAQGEEYRDGLIAQAQRLGVGDAVSFDSAYRTPAQLTALMQTASVVVLPYDSKDQVTSGVLVDSVASGRPIVATAFPHAVELLGSGAGTVVGPRRSRRTGGRPAADADRPARRRHHGLRGARAGAGDGVARRRQRVRRAWRNAWSRHGWPLHDRHCGTARFHPPAANDRSPRHFRACRPGRTAARARLLHRRHGQGARRRHPGARSRRVR